MVMECLTEIGEAKNNKQKEDKLKGNVRDRRYWFGGILVF